MTGPTTSEQRSTAGRTTLSRRALLRRALAFGLGVPGISTLLAACDAVGGGAPADEADAAETTAASSEGDETPTATGEAETPPGKRPHLRYGLAAVDVESLDPHRASTTADRTVVDMLFNALVRYHPGDSAQMEPDLALEIPKPEQENGKQVWTFTLRQGVMWHPGPKTESYELTADDVVYSLKRAADAESSAYADDYTGMTFEKVDDYTVKITLDTPLSPILFLPKVSNYSGGFIVSARAAEAMDTDEIKTHPVGTGPFMLKSYTPESTIELVAWDEYFRAAPELGGITLRLMPDVTARELALQSGELDVAAGLPQAQWVDRINAIDGLRADVFGAGEVVFINFDVSRAPLNDPRVRQALAYAISRDEHVSLFGQPVAEPVYSLVPAQLMAGGLTKEEADRAGVLYDTDLDKAAQLLAEAGYPDGVSFELVTSEMEAYRASYETLQAELRQIGVDVTLKVVDHSSYHEQIRENPSPIVIYIAARPNADAYLTQFFHSASIGAGSSSAGANYSHYDKIDDLIESARSETNQDKQIELWKEANVRILEDMAAFPLHIINQVYARSDEVDYGHPLKSSLALCPQITEKTTIETSD